METRLNESVMASTRSADDVRHWSWLVGEEVVKKGVVPNMGMSVPPSPSSRGSGRGRQNSGLSAASPVFQSIDFAAREFVQHFRIP